MKRNIQLLNPIAILYISLIIIMLISAPVSARKLTFDDSAEWYNLVSNGSYVPANAIDGDYGTWAQPTIASTSSKYLRINYSSSHSIRNCTLITDSNYYSGYYWYVYTAQGYMRVGSKVDGTYHFGEWTGAVNSSYVWVYFDSKMPLYNEFYCEDDDAEPLSPANFTGDPLDGYAPLSVDFIIQNFSWINATAGIDWAFGDGQTTTTNLSTMNHVYQNPGIYSVSLHYINTTGVEETLTKNNYILASNASGLIVNLDVKHAITGALIQDSTVGIQNTSTGVWRNVTAPTGLVYFSSTDPGYLYPLTQGQSITLAANKSGFSDASSTFNIPYNNYLVQLFLMPNTVINSTGNGTVVVNTIANKDGHSIPGISVSLDSGQMGITNSAGAVTLFNVSAGTRYAQIVDSQERFQGTSTSFDLSAGETKLVVVQMVYEGDDPVETPVSPTPTPTGTYDPDDPNSPVYGNYTTSEINQQGGAGVLGMLMQLIELWPVILIMTFLKFMNSAFK